MAGKREKIRFLGDLRRLAIKPGDKFVLFCAAPLTAEAHARIHETWKKFAGDAPLLILENGMKLGAVATAAVRAA